MSKPPPLPPLTPDVLRGLELGLAAVTFGEWSVGDVKLNAADRDAVDRAYGWLEIAKKTRAPEAGPGVLDVLALRGTLAVVREILRETAIPMTVREIVERAGEGLPTRSKDPRSIVARDLSMDIKRHGAASLFIRTSPGRYTLRSLVAEVAN